MVTYIYFVKCPNCEDEPFDFFDEAKGYAMGCLSQKPVITQTEVCRNDFGECTDSADLGQIWSWEDECTTEAEPTKAIFTKDDLEDYIPDEDPEFASIDNSVDFEPEIPEVSAVDAVPDNFRKPIPDGMTIDQLKEEMEENEDTVECTWCEELFDKSECRKEVDLGWLCSRCEMAIKSRGETLTFKEGNYWDFLDEGLNEELSFEDLIKDSINHLVNDLGKDPWAEDFGDDVVKDIENNYENEVPTDLAEYNSWANNIMSEVSRQVNRDYKLDEEVEPESVHDLGNTYDGGYPTTQTWICYFDGVDIGTVEAATEDEALEKMQQEYPEYPYGLRHEVDIWVEPVEGDSLTEASLGDILRNVNDEYGTDYTEPGLIDAEGLEDADAFADIETGIELYHDAQERKRARRDYAINKAKAAKLHNDNAFDLDFPEV